MLFEEERSRSSRLAGRLPAISFKWSMRFARNFLGQVLASSRSLGTLKAQLSYAALLSETGRSIKSIPTGQVLPQIPSSLAAVSQRLLLDKRLSCAAVF